MNTTHALVRSSLFRTANFLLTVIVTLVMTPLIVHSLGDRYYGSWTLIGTVIGYYGLLDFGLSSAVTRYVSQALGRHDLKSMSDTASTAFVLFTAISAVGFLVTLAIVAGCPLFVRDPTEVVFFRKVFIVMGTTVAIGFPFRVFTGILVSFLRHDYVALLSIGRAIGANALVYVALGAGHGLMALVVINSLASVCEYVSSYFLAHTKIPQVAVWPRHFARARVRELFAYSSTSLAIQMADLVRFRLDAVVIAIFLNVRLITYYSLGAGLIDYFGACLISMIGIAAPLFSQYEGRGDPETLVKRFLDITRISTAVSVFIGLSIIFYGKQFIEAWLGPGFESSYRIAVILCVPSIVALTQSPGIQLLYGLSKHHYFAISNTCEGLLNLLLSLLLVQSYGIYGVALGTALAMIVVKICVQPVLICRSIGLPVRQYLVDTICVTGAKVFLPLVIYYFLVRQYLRPDYLNMLLIGGLQTILLIPVVYVCALTGDIKDRIKSVLRVV
jgi:O-antigen/teichoic acid export membrane protein